MDDDARYVVLRNDEDQYSLWLAGHEVPAGWYQVGKEGSKEECSAFTSDPGATAGGTPIAINPGGFKSNWCGATFIAKLSADLTLGSLK